MFQAIGLKSVSPLQRTGITFILTQAKGKLDASVVTLAPLTAILLHGGSLLASDLFPRAAGKLQAMNPPTQHPLDQFLKDHLEEFLQHSLSKEGGLGVKPLTDLSVPQKCYLPSVPWQCRTYLIISRFS